MQDGVYDLSAANLLKRGGEADELYAQDVVGSRLELPFAVCVCCCAAGCPVYDYGCSCKGFSGVICYRSANQAVLCG